MAAPASSPKRKRVDKDRIAGKLHQGQKRKPRIRPGNGDCPFTFIFAFRHHAVKLGAMSDSSRLLEAAV
jgi:hypothetical protein